MELAFDCLEILTSRFKNSPDLYKIQLERLVSYYSNFHLIRNTENILGEFWILIKDLKMTFPPLRPTENRKGIDKSQKLRLGFFPNFCYSYRIFLIRNERDHVAILKKFYKTKSTLIEFITLYLKELLLKDKKDDTAKELIENCIVGMQGLAC